MQKQYSKIIAVPGITLILMSIIVTFSIDFNNNVSNPQGNWQIKYSQCTFNALESIKNCDIHKFRVNLKQGYKENAFPEWLLAYNKQMLASCAKNAILFTGDELDTTAAWYLQEIKNYRKDITVIPLGLLTHSWFMNRLCDPHIKWPFNSSKNKRIFFQKLMSEIEILQNHSIYSKSGRLKFISFLRHTEFPPCYFSIFCSSKFLFWLQNHLQVRGLTCQFIDKRHKLDIDGVNKESLNKVFHCKSLIQNLDLKQLPDSFIHIFFALYRTWCSMPMQDRDTKYINHIFQLHHQFQNMFILEPSFTGFKIFE